MLASWGPTDGSDGSPPTAGVVDAGLEASVIPLAILVKQLVKGEVVLRFDR